MVYPDVALTLIILHSLLSWLALAELSGEARLLEAIFKEYKKEARPCHNVSKPVQVSLGFTLTRLDALVGLRTAKVLREIQNLVVTFNVYQIIKL